MKNLSSVIKRENTNIKIKQYQPLLIGAEEELTEGDEGACVTSHISDKDIFQLYESLFLTAKSKATNIVTQAEKEAHSILQRAKSEDNNIRETAYNDSYKKGYENGFNAGQEEGMKVGRDQAITQAEPVFSALASLLEEARDIRKRTYLESNVNIIKLAFRLAEAVLHTKVHCAHDSLIGILDGILCKIADIDNISIKVHPEDIEYIEEIKNKLQSKYDFHNLSFIEDSSISRGGCIVKSDIGEVDARIDTMFEEVKKSLIDILKGELTKHCAVVNEEIDAYMHLKNPGHEKEKT